MEDDAALMAELLAISNRSASSRFDDGGDNGNFENNDKPAKPIKSRGTVLIVKLVLPCNSALLVGIKSLMNYDSKHYQYDPCQISLAELILIAINFFFHSLVMLSSR